MKREAPPSWSHIYLNFNLNKNYTKHSDDASADSFRSSSDNCHFVVVAERHYLMLTSARKSND